MTREGKLIKNVLVVTIPKDANYFSLHNDDEICKLIFSSDIQDPLNTGGDMIQLNIDSNSIPKILGKLSELTDKDCEEFVENDDCSDDFEPHKFKICYKNYVGNGEFEDSFENWNIASAKESFISLLQSEGVDTSNEDELLIIKML